MQTAKANVGNTKQKKTKTYILKFMFMIRGDIRKTNAQTLVIKIKPNLLQRYGLINIPIIIGNKAINMITELVEVVIVCPSFSRK